MDLLIRDGVLLRYTGRHAVHEIFVPEGVREIGDHAFSGAKTSYVHLPDSLERIGDDAFRECRSLKEIVIPAGVRSIGRGAFYSCRSLWEAKLPKALPALSSGLFGDCRSLQRVTIPEAVTCIQGSISRRQRDAHRRGRLSRMCLFPGFEDPPGSEKAGARCVLGMQGS